jgi:hypothetical protein
MGLGVGIANEAWIDDETRHSVHVVGDLEFVGITSCGIVLKRRKHVMGRRDESDGPDSANVSTRLSAADLVWSQNHAWTVGPCLREHGRAQER